MRARALWALSWLALVLQLGCAGPRATAGAQLAGDLFTCGAGEAAPVQEAILHGGSSWLTIVFEALKCVPSVVRDIQAMRQAQLDGVHLAAAGDAAPAIPVVSKRALRRAALALRLSQALGVGQ